MPSSRPPRRKTVWCHVSGPVRFAVVQVRLIGLEDVEVEGCPECEPEHLGSFVKEDDNDATD